MKCFYHPDRDAVGICKNCGRGLCAESLVDVGDGLACEGRCEERVRDIERLYETNIRASKSAGAGGAPFMIALGLALVAIGVTAALTRDEPRMLITAALGTIFLGWGGWVYAMFRRARAGSG